MKKYLECGKIVNTHGVKGAVKLESWCNSPEEMAELKRFFIKRGEQYIEHKVEKASVFKQFVIAELEDVVEFEIALSLKNTVVYAAREDFKLDEGDYFIADIIGLQVIDDESGKVYGILKDVINKGASDIYVVDTEQGERMMPAVPEFVKKVDPNKGIFILPIDGMFD